VDKEVLQMQMSSFFVAKNFGFFEIYDVSARTKRVKLVRIFSDEGRGESVFL